MNLAFAAGLSAAIAVVILLAIVLMLFRSCIIPCLGRCRGRPSDEERARPTPNSKVADAQPGEKTGRLGIRKFEWSEIESLTGDFTAAPVIGQGGFSTVYLARLPASAPGKFGAAAVKVQRSSERLRRAFLGELDVLRRVSHPRIVRFLGFCDDREEGVLVFEYVPNGSLHETLHGVDGAVILPWARRMRIAVELAAAVDYLHEGCDLQIVHGDLTASNVLLDRRLEPKLCDFGSARMGFSAAVQPPSSNRQVGPMVGSPGYADPHYLRTGIISKKSDVYSFGVLILELVTGIPAFRSDEERLLTVEMGPRVKQGGKGVEGLMDPRLKGEFDGEEAAAMAEIAGLCIGDRPSLRPSMAEIVRIMRDKLAASLSAVGVGSDGKTES